jgi:Spy/CpxP family protein refolding chaperone
MTKLRKVLLGCIGLYVFGAVSLVCADTTPTAQAFPQKEKYEGKGIQEIYNQLNLTEIQKKQLENNKIQHRAKIKSDREQMKSYREAFQQELMKPLLDMNKINEIHNQLKALESQMADDRLNSILTVRTILTPQQFSEFATLMHKHKLERANTGGKNQRERQMEEK